MSDDRIQRLHAAGLTPEDIDHIDSYGTGIIGAAAVLVGITAVVIIATLHLVG